MTKYGRMTSDVRTTDPDSKIMKTKDFRGTGGVFYRRGLTIICVILFSTCHSYINLIVTMFNILQIFAGVVSSIFVSKYFKRKQSLGGVASEYSRDM